MLFIKNQRPRMAAFVSVVSEKSIDKRLKDSFGHHSNLIDRGMYQRLPSAKYYK